MTARPLRLRCHRLRLSRRRRDTLQVDLAHDHGDTNVVPLVRIIIGAGGTPSSEMPRRTDMQTVSIVRFSVL